MQSFTTIDPAEAAKFAAMANEWHNPLGKFKTLHHINPVRLGYITQYIAQHFGARPLRDLQLLDIGCGGGLIAEPLARLGAQVTGVDAAQKNITCAQEHAQRMGLNINYHCTAIEHMTQTFDVVLALEVVEHVADVGLFLRSCVQRLSPSGLLILSTLNRTPQSYLAGIVAAEYVLRLLPRGTHSWQKFVRPAEAAAHLSDAGLTVTPPTGMRYNPLTHKAWLCNDTSVNYLLCATRPA